MNQSLTIHDIAFGGKGVGRHDGKVYFVPFTAPEDVVNVRITRDKKKFAEAKVVEVITPSPDRVTPECPHFGICGGCAYQHIAYPRQLALKQQQVEQTLRRVGRLVEIPMRPIIPAPQPYHFRNRIRVHVVNGAVGFFAHESHSLVEIGSCAIAEPKVNTALADLRKRRVPDGDYVLSAGDRGRFFEQTNDAVGRELLRIVEEAVPAGRQVLIDAYCGAGFFAKHLLSRFEKIVGLEENEFAIAHARKHASPKEQYFAGDVALFLGEILAAQDPAETTVLLDPPAVGLSPLVVQALLLRPVADLLYISCNPATLARDLAALGAGYRLEAVTPLDMFPQTAEVEVFAQLVRL